MYDIRQFKPTLYLLLFLGISGFALAAVLVQPVERRHGASIAGVPVHHIWTDEDLAAVS